MRVETTDCIEKRIVLRSPRSRVWRAITDAREFGAWFGVKIDGKFEEGASARGMLTIPGMEHVSFEVTVERIEPERLFSYRWHPNATDPEYDYSAEPTTLVEFRLEEVDEGTLLTVVESGFDGIPIGRRDEAFRGNEGGWTFQVENIREYVEAG